MFPIRKSIFLPLALISFLFQGITYCWNPGLPLIDPTPNEIRNAFRKNKIQTIIKYLSSPQYTNEQKKKMVKKTDKYDETPLFSAIMLDDLLAVRLFVQWGANTRTPVRKLQKQLIFNRLSKIFGCFDLPIFLGATNDSPINRQPLHIYELSYVNPDGPHEHPINLLPLIIQASYPYTITIKTIDGNSSMKVSSSSSSPQATIKELKELVLKKLGLKFEKSVLVFNKKPLQDETMTLAQAGIKSGSTLCILQVFTHKRQLQNQTLEYIPALGWMIKRKDKYSQ